MTKICFLLGAALTTVGCSSFAAKETPIAAKERKVAADFTLTDANGVRVKLSDYKGKVVLLNFWATWCGPCNIEVPWFIDFEKRYEPHGLVVLGISMDDDWDAVKPYLEAKKVNYPVALGNDHVAELYGGVGSLPTTFLIDRRGTIASMHVGLVSRATYQQEITYLLTH
jgi:peroxiredoxin